jgi:hypothetical protein
MSENIIIVVESVANFYELLNSRLSDVKNKHGVMIDLYDHFHASINGCACRKDKNLVAANEFYKQLKDMPQEIKDEIKAKLNAIKLLFFENKDLFIFEF